MLSNATHFIVSLVFFFFYITLHHIGPSHLEYVSHKLYCVLINKLYWEKLK